MRTNVGTSTRLVTHEGGKAAPQKPLEELTRAVSTCLLFENTFYERGSEIATRIQDLCKQVSAEDLAALAVRARTDLKLRHVPLFLARELARLHQGRIVSDTLSEILQRPDELGEFVALYWREGKQPLSAQSKKGLAKAFTKFSEYQLAKWDRGGESTVKLRDVLFLCHAKPKDAEQDALWKRLIDGTLEVPDTWEVALSSGADKKATWERLLRERKLGYMATLMNLRNMQEAGVDHALVETSLVERAKGSKALPFRFVSAAKHAMGFAQACNDAMLASLEGAQKLPGSTAVVVDVSGSMNMELSRRSTLNRWEAAAALAVLFRELTPYCRVFTFSDMVVEVPNLRGLHLVSDVGRSQQHNGTYLTRALEVIKASMPNVDRVVVITDEQSHDGILQAWAPHSYLVNVAPYQPGLDMRQGWHRVSGWSERLVDWIALEETGSLL